MRGRPCLLSDSRLRRAKKRGGPPRSGAGPYWPERRARGNVRALGLPTEVEVHAAEQTELVPIGDDAAAFHEEAGAAGREEKPTEEIRSHVRSGIIRTVL